MTEYYQRWLDNLKSVIQERNRDFAELFIDSMRPSYDVDQKTLDGVQKVIDDLQSDDKLSAKVDILKGRKELLSVAFKMQSAKQ